MKRITPALKLTAVLLLMTCTENKTMSLPADSFSSAQVHTNNEGHYPCPAGFPPISQSWKIEDCPKSQGQYNNRGLTPLQAAVKARNLSQIVFLVEVCKVSVSEYSNSTITQETALHKAARAGSADIICYLLYNKNGLKASVNLRQNSQGGKNPGFAPLHNAVLAKNPVPALEMLLHHPEVKINLVSDSGLTALDVAFESNEKTAYNYLLSMNGTHAPCPQEMPQLDFKEYGGGALFAAAIFGNYRRLERLVNKCKADVHVRNSHNYTILHTAAYNSQPKLVDLLLRMYHLDPNGGNFETGKTPLLYAVISKAPEPLYHKTIELLLNAGANINQMTRTWRWTPMCLARDSTRDIFLSRGALNFSCNANTDNQQLMRLQHTWKNAMDIHPVLEKIRICYPKDAPRLIAAIGVNTLIAQKGRDDIETLLAEYGVPVETIKAHTISSHDSTEKDSHGTFHEAVKAGSKLSILAKLIKEGADVNSNDALGWTPLHIAADKGDFQTAAFLVSRSASLTDQTFNSHYTPLNLAILKGHKDLTAFLKDIGGKLGSICRTDTSSDHHWTEFLSMAVASKNTVAAEVALACGADHGQPMASPGNGTMFPIHVACMNCDAVMVNLLLNHGVDPNLRVASTPAGFTPVHFAVKAMVDPICNPKTILESLGKRGADLNMFALDQDGNQVNSLELLRRTGRKDYVMENVDHLLTEFRVGQNQPGAV